MITIEEFYNDKVAERSGVPLINHINEGVLILEALQADKNTIEAFKLHPIFQEDVPLLEYHTNVGDLDPIVVLYVMEYRNIANRALSNIVQDGILTKPIYISPIFNVNLMLVADKVQNRKDFITYHRGTHPRSNDLDVYFSAWLDALGIGEESYNTLCEIIELHKSK